MLHCVHLLVINFVRLVVLCWVVDAQWVKSYKVVNKQALNSTVLLLCMSKPDSTLTQLI